MKYLKHYFDWNNEKINRKEWWYSLVLLIFVSLVIMFLFMLLGELIVVNVAIILGLILMIAYFYSFINMSRKRLKDIGLNPYICFLLLIPTGDMALVIICGFMKSNYMQDMARKKLARNILLTPILTTLFLIIVWSVVAFIYATNGLESGFLEISLLPFLLGLSVVMILPCFMVNLILRSKNGDMVDL